MDVESLKALNKDKKKVKKLACKYSFFLASASIMKQIPRLLGPTMHKLGKFPTLVEHSDDLTEKIDGIRSTVKFQLKKVLTMGVAAGHVEMTPDQVYANTMITVNFLIKQDVLGVTSHRPCHCEDEKPPPNCMRGCSYK